MPITDAAQWTRYVEANKDSYGGACVRVAEKVMRLLDERPEMNADALVHEAALGEGITGFMAGCVASMVSKVHSRGEEFRKSWNRAHGIEDGRDTGGVANPAILEIKKDAE